MNDYYYSTAAESIISSSRIYNQQQNLYSAAAESIINSSRIYNQQQQNL